MTERERTTTMSVSADEAYVYLSDPRHLSDYVPTMEHLETVVVGEDELPDDAEHAEGRFFADASSRSVEWAAPGAGFALSIVVGEGTSRTSQVTVRLRTDDHTDPATLEGMLERAVAGLRRALSMR